jgi:hypothetical protein
VSDKRMKVTDRRMFTPEGELREEFRELATKDTGTTESGAAPDGDRAPEPETRFREPAPPPSAEGSEPRADSGPKADGRERLELPGTPQELGGPGFIDLLAMLANPAALYLGEARLPDGESVEDLDMARWHIDLLDVLRTSTTGNLAAREAAALDDLLYQLRLRYVQKKG